ncbi:MAG: histidine kinase [Devosiaceae bacterium]|nr:histidine kinase [Devosiaceae bacterium MH13]
MPTTFRLLFRICVLGALVTGAMYALATYVEPTPEPISIRFPTERFE